MSVLRGRRVLVTRPRHQAQGLQEQLAARGAQAIALPLFEIQVLGDAARQRQTLRAARDCTAWIFTSANAADCAAQLHTGDRPPLLAVGAATARALAARGHAGARTPATGSSSEALLELPELAAVGGQRFLLCTGAGGRTRIEDTLRDRGAEVERLELYQRIATAHAPTVLAEVLSALDAAILTSAESLARLHQLAPPSLLPRLLAQPVVVPSARVLELARQLGFAAPHAPTEMSDDALVACLERAFGPA